MSTAGSSSPAAHSFTHTELAEATREHSAAEGEDWTWRIKQAGHQLHEAERFGTADSTDDEGKAVSEIQLLLDKQVYKLKKR